MSEDEEAPIGARAASRLGVAFAMLLLVDVGSLVKLGWEAWGGVAILALAGASSVTWRVRPTIKASSRAAGFAVLAGVAFAVGALARESSPFPLIILLGLAMLALEPERGNALRLAALTLLLFGVGAGFLAVPWSTSQRMTQVGAALALGASIAGSRFGEEGGVTPRVAFALAGAGAAAWALA